MSAIKELGQAMVAPKSTPPKQVSPSINNGSAAAAAAAKMHRRSRSGCFTCRLRRKKCDEGKPGCKACRHLGLKCEYKRPLWWGNNEHRKNQKDAIKNIIKRTKLTDKSKDSPTHGTDSPPGLSHSLPTSATYSDPMGRTRAVSEDSQYSFDFNHQVPIVATTMSHEPFDIYAPQVYTPQVDANMHYYPYPPPPNAYEVDIKTERQTYVDDVPTRRDSTRSTFSTFHPPPPHGSLATVPEDDWLQEDIYETVHADDMFGPGSCDTGIEESGLDFGYFDFSHGPAPHSRGSQALIQVDECDRPLLEHFIDNVLRLIFPVLEVNQHGSARSDVILPALESNKCYLHCCLSIAAIHLKSMQPPGQANEQLDADIVRHRYATISELCEALNRDTEHTQILEATLGMIFFQCSVGRPDDALPDIPWHQHFQAASSLVRKLELPDAMQAASQALQTSAHPSPPPINMTLTSWIDILGATMIGRAPLFANTYREMHLSGASSGLAELMGCDDRIMYLISEIACLEALKLASALDETNLCSHITLLGQQIDLTEPPNPHPHHPHHHQNTPPPVICPQTGAVRPALLSRAMTALFRIAARMWLMSLIPGASKTDNIMRVLQAQFADLLARVPTGPGGFDRCIVWPLLMAGAQSTADGPLRAAVAERVQAMGGEAAADTGAFGRMRRLLVEVWEREEACKGEQQHHEIEAAEGRVVWREIMKEKGWDFLLL